MIRNQSPERSETVGMKHSGRSQKMQSTKRVWRSIKGTLSRVTDHGGIPRMDCGMIAAAALFEEHCRKKSKRGAYPDGKNIEENQREWLFNERMDCIFAAHSLVKCCESSWTHTITSTPLQPLLPPQCRIFYPHST